MWRTSCGKVWQLVLWGCVSLICFLPHTFAPPCAVSEHRGSLSGEIRPKIHSALLCRAVSLFWMLSWRGAPWCIHSPIVARCPLAVTLVEAGRWQGHSVCPHWDWETDARCRRHTSCYVCQGLSAWPSRPTDLDLHACDTAARVKIYHRQRNHYSPQVILVQTLIDYSHSLALPRMNECFSYSARWNLQRTHEAPKLITVTVLQFDLIH